MRRLHNMVKGWGPLLADSTTSMPQLVAKPSDNANVRWAARATNKSEGFLFVNNYQRLEAQTAKKAVRFQVTLLDGTSTIAIPSAKSPPIAIKSGLWFAFPFNLPLIPSFAHAPGFAEGGVVGPTLGWATAQLQARLDATEQQQQQQQQQGRGQKKVEYIFLLEIDGILPEVALAGINRTALLLPAAGTATASQEGTYTVLRGIVRHSLVASLEDPTCFRSCCRAPVPRF
eukprot:SAG25_NODE_488_length_7463_cov_6.443781_5_plen_230_part_00